VAEARVANTDVIGPERFQGRRQYSLEAQLSSGDAAFVCQLVEDNPFDPQKKIQKNVLPWL
jgi:hypothetical protein